MYGRLLTQRIVLDDKLSNCQYSTFPICVHQDTVLAKLTPLKNERKLLTQSQFELKLNKNSKY